MPAVMSRLIISYRKCGQSACKDLLFAPTSKQTFPTVSTVRQAITARRHDPTNSQPKIVGDKAVSHEFPRSPAIDAQEAPPARPSRPMPPRIEDDALEQAVARTAQPRTVLWQRHYEMTQFAIGSSGNLYLTYMDPEAWTVRMLMLGKRMLKTRRKRLTDRSVRAV